MGKIKLRVSNYSDNIYLMVNVDKAGVKSNIAESELVRGELMVSPE